MKTLGRKVFNFGKIALFPYTKTRKCLVEVTIECRESETFNFVNGKKEITNDVILSFTAGFWNGIKSDYYICGQCYDEIEEEKHQFSKADRERWEKIYSLWKKYHLKKISEISDEDKQVFGELGINFA